jgi:hypothetical protein
MYQEHPRGVLTTEPMNVDKSHIPDMKSLLQGLHAYKSVRDTLIEGEGEGRSGQEGDVAQGSLITSLGVTWRGNLRVVKGRWVLFH